MTHIIKLDGPYRHFGAPVVWWARCSCGTYQSLRCPSAQSAWRAGIAHAIAQQTEENSQATMNLDNGDDPRQIPYIYVIDGTAYVWFGGAYVDIGAYRADSDGPFHRTDRCLNVWDYGTDQPTIGRTRATFLGLIADDQGLAGTTHWSRGLPRLAIGHWVDPHDFATTHPRPPLHR